MLTAADEAHHIDKRDFKIPFVCGAQNLGEALRRIAEGAAMIRLKGNAGTGNVVQATRHARSVRSPCTPSPSPSPNLIRTPTLTVSLTLTPTLTPTLTLTLTLTLSLVLSQTLTLTPSPQP